jgi:probable HAF family extracellular repeat protein
LNVCQEHPSRFDHRFANAIGSATAQSFIVTDLGTLGGLESHAYAIGAWGQIVGDSELSDDGEYHAFLYSGRTMQELSGLSGQVRVARAINASSQVAGYYYDHGYRAFLWTDGRVTDLGDFGMRQTVAYALNNAGHVVGLSRTPAMEDHAFLYRDGRMTDLGTLGGDDSVASSINDREQITGYAYDEAGDFFAFGKTKDDEDRHTRR